MKNILLLVFIFILSFNFSNVVVAQNDQATEKALKDTQNLLKNKSQREALFKKDSKAKEADSKVNSVTGDDAANSQKLYDISADIMPSLMQAVGNDPNKAMELLQKAQTDPEGFYKSLPPEIREKIRGVASDIESKNAAKKSP